MISKNFLASKCHESTVFEVIKNVLCSILFIFSLVGGGSLFWTKAIIYLFIFPNYKKVDIIWKYALLLKLLSHTTMSRYDLHCTTFFQKNTFFNCMGTRPQNSHDSFGEDGGSPALCILFCGLHRGIGREPGGLLTLFIFSLRAEMMGHNTF